MSDKRGKEKAKALSEIETAIDNSVLANEALLASLNGVLAMGKQIRSGVKALKSKPDPKKAARLAKQMEDLKRQMDKLEGLKKSKDKWALSALAKHKEKKAEIESDD